MKPFTNLVKVHSWCIGGCWFILTHVVHCKSLKLHSEIVYIGFRSGSVGRPIGSNLGLSFFFASSLFKYVYSLLGYMLHYSSNLLITFYNLYWGAFQNVTF